MTWAWAGAWAHAQGSTVCVSRCAGRRRARQAAAGRSSPRGGSTRREAGEAAAYEGERKNTKQLPRGSHEGDGVAGRAGGAGPGDRDAVALGDGHLPGEGAGCRMGECVRGVRVVCRVGKAGAAAARTATEEEERAVASAGRQYGARRTGRVHAALGPCDPCIPPAAHVGQAGRARAGVGAGDGVGGDAVDCEGQVDCVGGGLDRGVVCTSQGEARRQGEGGLDGGRARRERKGYSGRRASVTAAAAPAPVPTAGS